MADTPKVRFKGFTGAWEQRKLGEIILDYTEKNPDGEDLPVLTSSRQGIQKQEDHFGSEQKHDTTDYNVIPKGYCTYRNRSDDKTFTFNVNDCVQRGIVSKFYPVFSIENGDAKFITEYLNTNAEIRN
ncbi:MAG: restriction endonuclease subunit S, partial [Lachnospiraceae bacterium]|nr:restriction endonuclease subunit S [Lachnospiraceae bacterium]